MKAPILPILTFLSLSPFAGAAVIGTEDFATNGLIGDQTGGTGFDWNNLTNTHTTTVSDWDNVTGTPSVVGNALVTNNTSAKREYNGPIEGTGSDTDPNAERSGAFRGVGSVFYRFNITRTASATWSGASSYDFNNPASAEKIFFGVHGGGAATDTVGIQISGGGANVNSAISLTDDTTYTLVTVLDFDNDLLGIWVDPNATDDWDATGGTADATLAYTGSNWSTALRLGSGGQATWDNLTIANIAADVGLLGIPEPSTSLLAGLGALALLRRRRR